jgi:aromatic-L-amino-acid/L-tryptophan decarboxylase
VTPEEFRKAGHDVVDWIADFRATLENRPVMARTAPGEVARAFPAAPPETPQDPAEIFSALDRTIVPGLTHFGHPRFFGFFPTGGNLSSVLGDFLSTGLGALGLTWQAAPALTELEEVTTDWVRQLLGLSPAWRGVIQDTASTSTLVALVCARERTSGYALMRAGLQGGGSPLVVYASAQSHSSVLKAALVAGFGRDHVREIPTDDAHAMHAGALDAAMREDQIRGWTPCAVVATSGSTTCTAFDPIGAIADVCERHGAWLHVDAAMAGSAMILEECRPLWHGVERADSLVVNPHKWLGAIFDCSLYLVRDAEHLVRVMSTNPAYLQSAAAGDVTTYRDWGIALGRRFRALKLWTLLHLEGAAAIRARIRRDLAHARWLAAAVAATPGWRVVAPVPLQTVCVRHEPDGVTGEPLDAHTRAWCDRVNASGVAYLTAAVLDGRWMVRVAMGAPTTERRHVEETWRAMQDAVR